MSSCSSSSPPVTPPSSDSEDDDFDFDRPKRRYSQDKQPSPHPLAASTKADREPPSYSKRHAFTPVSSPREKIFFPTSCPPEPIPQPSRIRTPVIHPRSPSTVDIEQTRWDAVIANAIDKAESKVDLSFANLTYVPPSIVDLRNLYTLPRRELFPSPEASRTFQRSTTAPASSGLFNHSPTLLPAPEIATHSRPFARAETTNKLSSGFALLPPAKLSSKGTQHNNLELYLMSNRIRSLPRELFELDRLVVLSLRRRFPNRFDFLMNWTIGGNKLTSLPPAIGRLRSLRELNIANNRISFLPAEIQALQLNTLHLHPNPFEALPDMSTSLGDKRLLGALKRGPIIPSLGEFALRYLLASDNGQLTRMERALSVSEIGSLPVPGHMHRIIQASTGHDRARLSRVTTDDIAELDMRSNNCPSPHHLKAARMFEKAKNVRFHIEDMSAKEFVFNTPVEERMEWVGQVAGVTIGNTPKAFIPILWRGCGCGCLDFLEIMPSDSDTEVDMPSPIFTAGSKVFGSTIESNSEFEFSDSE